MFVIYHRHWWWDVTHMYISISVSGRARYRDACEHILRIYMVGSQRPPSESGMGGRERGHLCAGEPEEPGNGKRPGAPCRVPRESASGGQSVCPGRLDRDIQRQEERLALLWGSKEQAWGVFCSVGQSSGNTQNRAKLICQEFLMQADTTINYHIIHLHLCFTAPFPPHPPSRDQLLVYRMSLFTPTFWTKLCIVWRNFCVLLRK